MEDEDGLDYDMLMVEAAWREAAEDVRRKVERDEYIRIHNRLFWTTLVAILGWLTVGILAVERWTR